MGKKKRNHPDAEEILSRPWCYYCERDFDDLKILISHQKAKHFKCERCGRRLNTAGGLSVHMNQVHKENLTTVENALPNRSNPDVEIFGMEGMPEDVVTAHNQRVLTQIQQAEAERRAATGNPGPGGSAGAGIKKPKFESPADLKKRLAEHKAKVAEQSSGGNSGGGTPINAGQAAHSPNIISGGSATQIPFSQTKQGYGLSPNLATFQPLSQPYEVPGAAYQQPQSALSSQQVQQVQHTYQAPGPQSFHVPAHQFGSAQQLPAASVQAFSPQYPGFGTPFGSAASPPPYLPSHRQPLGMDTPPQDIPGQPHLGSLPPAVPGLPQRPSVGAPPVNAFQLHQMHQGQISVPSLQQAGPSHSGAWSSTPNGNFPRHDNSPSGVPSTNLPPSASAQFGITTSPVNSAPDRTGPTEPVATKNEELAEEENGPKIKKEKDKEKATKLVYSDKHLSPEEKMASLPRYAFVPTSKKEIVLGDATTPAVTGVVDPPDF